MRTQLIESAWAYQSGPAVGDKPIGLRRRQDGVPAETLKRAWATQARLVQTVPAAGGPGELQERGGRPPWPGSCAGCWGQMTAA